MARTGIETQSSYTGQKYTGKPLTEQDNATRMQKLKAAYGTRYSDKDLKTNNQQPTPLKDEGYEEGGLAFAKSKIGTDRRIIG